MQAVQWLADFVDEQVLSLRQLWMNKRQVRKMPPENGAAFSALALQLTARAIRNALPRHPPPQLTFQLLNLSMIVFSALMIWKGLMFLTLSESPVVVVLR